MARKPKRRRGKQSSDEMATLAARTMRDPKASPRARRLAASVVSQADGPEDDEVVDTSKRLSKDPERKSRASEIQKRCRGKTRDLADGKIRGRARPGPSR